MYISLDPLFSVTPNYCQTTLIGSNPGLEFAMSFFGFSQAYIFFEQSSLALVGPTQTVYPVTTTFTVTDYSGGTKDYPSTFNFVIKNPCTDPDYVEIISPTYDVKYYVVKSGEKTFLPAEDPF